MAPRSELQDLVSLFDDPDETVAACVDRRLLEMGREVLPALEELRRAERDPQHARLIAGRQRQFNEEFRLEDLKRLARSCGTAGFSLFEAGFLISSLCDYSLTREAFTQAVEACASAYRNESSDQRTALENARIFSHLFFHRLGFTIRDEGMTDPLCARLPDVLEQRKGNPIAIAYLYFLLAEENGLPLYPLCFPGGFVPAWLEDGKELFYINLQAEGDILMLRDLRAADVNHAALRSVSVLPVMLLESLQYQAVATHDATRSFLLERALDKFGTERFLTVDDDPEAPSL